MQTFFETILIKNTEPLHLEYHQKRVDYTSNSLGFKPPILRDIIKKPNAKDLKCKVSYADRFYKVELMPLQIREMSSLCLVVDDEIEYRYKSSQRDRLNRLYEKRGSCSDVLIIKNSLITDTTVANVAFFDGKRWLTPSSVLLKGTTRARLIESGFLQESKIELKMLHNFQKIAVMNALIGFVELKKGIIFKK